VLPRRSGLCHPDPHAHPPIRYDEGVELLHATMAGVPYGDPQRPDVIMGPLISEKQRSRVLGYIQRGVDEGATLALGGRRPKDLTKGWYVEPTLFTDVDNSMAIAREEIFGPVLVVIPFDDDDDAVRIANDSNYGLGGMVSATAGPFARRGQTVSAPASLSVNGGALRRRRALRRLQGQRHRAAERHGWVRSVPRDQVVGLARRLIAASGGATSERGIDVAGARLATRSSFERRRRSS
jgi:acyl-CoA reductase-like NAD-dependent aldehyde dehydrogenase